EVLVVEAGHGPAALLEHSYGLFEPLVARVELLAFFIVWIVAVLGNDYHTVDGEFRTAQRQGFGHGRKLPEPVSLNALPRQISLRKLIDIDRGDFNPGP